MKLSTSKLGVALAGLYPAIIVVVVIQDQLLAFYLTLPFSLVLSLVLETLVPGTLGSSLGLLVVLAISAVINAVFLYLLGAFLGRTFFARRRA